jgi:hypothetical protein
MKVNGQKTVVDMYLKLNVINICCLLGFGAFKRFARIRGKNPKPKKQRLFHSESFKIHIFVTIHKISQVQPVFRWLNLPE